MNNVDSELLSYVSGAEKVGYGACNHVSTQKQTIHLSSLKTELSQKLSAMSGKSLDSKTSSWIRTLSDFSPEHHTGRRTSLCCSACHPEVLGAPDMSLMMLSHIAWAAHLLCRILKPSVRPTTQDRAVPF